MVSDGDGQLDPSVIEVQNPDIRSHGCMHILCDVKKANNSKYLFVSSHFCHCS